MKLLSLNLNETQAEHFESRITLFTSAFWKRQFQTESTYRQKFFDYLFGIILPVVCVVFDPLVFKGRISKGALLGSSKPFAYILSFISIMSLLAFILWGRKLGWFNGFLTGLFAVGAVVSFAVGIILLPLSLLGIFFVIGILGFTPLFAAFVYFRNAVRAYKFAKPELSRTFLWHSFILSAIFSLTVPYVFDAKIYKDLETMKNGDAQTIYKTAQKFEYIAPIVNFDILAGNYCDSEDKDEQKALSKVYQHLTGKSMERLDYAICNDF